NGTAVPSAYQRAPLNSSHTPLVAARAGVGIICTIVRRGRERSILPAVGAGCGATIVPLVPTPAGATEVPLVPVAPAIIASRAARSVLSRTVSDAISTGNDGVRLPTVPASSPSRFRSYARMFVRLTGT